MLFWYFITHFIHIRIYDSKEFICYVMLWGIYLPSVCRLQFSNDSRIALLEANQHRPKLKYQVNKSNFYILCELKFKTIILICVHIKTSKLHKLSEGRGLKIFVFVWNIELQKKHSDGIFNLWIFRPKVAQKWIQIWKFRKLMSE